MTTSAASQGHIDPPLLGASRSRRGLRETRAAARKGVRRGQVGAGFPWGEARNGHFPLYRKPDARFRVVALRAVGWPRAPGSQSTTPLIPPDREPGPES